MQFNYTVSSFRVVYTRLVIFYTWCENAEWKIIKIQERFTFGKT